MKASFDLLLAALLTGVVALPAQALPGDSAAAIRIESDTAEMDEKQGVSVYRGRVRISQGTVRIRADKVTVESTRDGVSKIVATGRPAHYQHQPKAEESIVHAYGEVIQYFADDQKVVILKNARLEQDDNTFIGDRINYDIQKQLVKAHSDGSTTSGSTSRQRVEIVIQPSKKKEPQQQ